MLFIIAEQAGQVPKVKTPPLVPPKPPRAPKHSLSQSVEKSPSATTPSCSRTLSEGTHKPPPPPTPPKPQKAKILPKQPEKSSSATTQTCSQTLSESTHKPPPPPKAPKPQKVLPKQPEQQQQSSLKPSEQSQDSSSLEYITLKEMLADFVDLLAGNAPVITQLNNHFLSLNIIPQDVHNAVTNPYPTPNERATRLIKSLLSSIQIHPNPNSAFASLITVLRKVGLTTIATKLSDALSKRYNC